MARWLRLLGYDTVWERSAGPAELLALAEAENRVLLTRDTLLPERRAARHGLVHVVLVPDDRLVDQLRQLREEQGLTRRDEPRCMVCNSTLEFRAVETVREWVPAYVAATQTEFMFCRRCDRVTWPGTHWEHMRRELAAAGFDEPRPAAGSRSLR